IPFVPLRGALMADAVRAAHALGPALAGELGVPVFYYGEAALRPERRELAPLRRGQFEELAPRMRAPGGEPDAGPSVPHPRAGATAIGARAVLIAFNAVLDSEALGLAQDIARVCREAGGGLPGGRALGVPLTSRGLVQVTMNRGGYRRARVAAVIRMRALTSLVSASTRDATFTGSPMIVYSSLSSEPTLPEMTCPEWIPTPTSSRWASQSPQRLFSSPMWDWISSAVLT